MGSASYGFRLAFSHHDYAFFSNYPKTIGESVCLGQCHHPENIPSRVDGAEFCGAVRFHAATAVVQKPYYFRVAKEIQHAV
jgi:hypothetical protein